MPHKCTKCGTTIEDGSDELLEGCCDGASFEYIKSAKPKENTDEIQTENNDEIEELTKSNMFANMSGGERVTDAEEVSSILDSQFEAVSVVREGVYEINLQKLIEGQTAIIRVEEDGRYNIDIPDAFETA